MDKSEIEVLVTDSGSILAEKNLLIARFFDADKVAKLIANPGIWLSRFDKMSDEKEGAYYELTRPRGSSFTTDQMEMIQSMRRDKHMPLVSCWTLFNSREQKGMWDAYGPEPGSICCVTTVKRLWQSLEISSLCKKGFIPCGSVGYYSPKLLNSGDDRRRLEKPVFYRPSDVEDSVYHSTEFVKRDCFSGEKEVRFICLGNGERMLEEDAQGYLAKFKDLRSNMPFLRIIARPDIAPSAYLELQDLFGCSVAISEVAGPGTTAIRESNPQLSNLSSTAQDLQTRVTVLQEASDGCNNQ